MTGIFGVITIILCLFLGAPVFCVFGAAAMLGWYMDGTSISVVGTDIFRLSGNFVLVTIPMFTYAGYLLGESGAPGRLVKVSRAMFGMMPGGLAIVSITACSIFTAFTGASGITIAALGSLLLPALLHDKYSENFALGLVTTGGSLGLLFAPSVPLVIYAVITETPVTDMFIAGIIPGLLMLFILSVFSVYIALRDRVPRSPLKLKAMAEALWEARWEAPLPFVVLGGLYAGVFAVSEAAAVTAFWVLIVEVLIHKEISLALHRKVILDSMVMVGGILIIMAAALGLTNYFIDVDVPMMIFDFIQGIVSTRLMFLILLNCFLFVLGMILDIFSALVVVVPLITPVAQTYGINNVHLGIIFLANMQIGYMTPPLGIGLFISSYRFDKGILRITAACLPFIIMLISSVLVITYWQDLSLFLLRLMGKQY